MVSKLAIDGGQPVRTAPFGPWWIFGDEERQQLMEVMDQASTKWRSRFKVHEFTRAVSELYGTRHVFGTSCGTGAVHAAVAAINPDPGDEIITTSKQFSNLTISCLLINSVKINVISVRHDLPELIVGLQCITPLKFLTAASSFNVFPCFICTSFSDC